MKTLRPLGLVICAVLLTTSALLSGCRDDGPNSNIGYVKYEIAVDGCQVKYVDNPRGSNFFVARCPGESVTTTHIQQNGKSHTTVPVVTTQEVDDLKKKLAEAQAKQAALDKLTPEDRKLLGIK